MIFNTGSESMRITTAGNVGIGTTNPIVKLDVSGHIRIGSGNYFMGADVNDSYLPSTGAFAGYNHNFTFTNSATAGELVRITNQGNVGIGLHTF
jgi:hypothetical protein